MYKNAHIINVLLSDYHVENLYNQLPDQETEYLLLFSCSVMSDSAIPMDCNPPGSSVHRISQVGMLKWIAISFSRGSSRPRNRTQVSHIAGR